MPKINSEIKGLKDLQKDFERLTKAQTPDRIEAASRKSAEIIRDEAERRAPQGPTGKLKEAQVVKALNRGTNYASVIAAVDRAIAPHAHLVEEGTAHSAANPFFRQAVMAKSGQAYRTFKDELNRLVERAVR